MKLCVPLLTILALGAFANAFTSTSLQRTHHRPSSRLYLQDYMDENSVSVDYSPFEQGSHDELMYALGVNLARQLGDVRPLVDNGEELASVAKGLLDTVIGRLSEDGQRNLLAQRGQELNQIIAQRANEIRYKLAETGRQMLQEMSDKPESFTLEGGVVVDVTQPVAQGTRPTRDSTIKVHYHGTLADGTVFDSTLDGEPVTFALEGVIPGWQQAILEMREGETAMVGIPPELAYGETGTPDGRVPGGSTLFFKVELQEVLSAGIQDEPQGILQDDYGNQY